MHALSVFCPLLTTGTRTVVFILCQSTLTQCTVYIDHPIIVLIFYQCIIRLLSLVIIFNFGSNINADNHSRLQKSSLPPSTQSSQHRSEAAQTQMHCKPPVQCPIVLSASPLPPPPLCVKLQMSLRSRASCEGSFELWVASPLCYKFCQAYSTPWNSDRKTRHSELLGKYRFMPEPEVQWISIFTHPEPVLELIRIEIILIHDLHVQESLPWP